MKSMIPKIMIVALAAGMLTACGSGKTSGINSSANASSKPDVKAVDYFQQPVKLVVYSNAGGTEDGFNQTMGDALKKKFPNVSFEFIPRGGDVNVQSLIAGGSDIDLILDSVGGLGATYTFLTSNIQMDISDLVKKHNVDLSRVEPETIDAVKQFGGLYGLPYMNTSMLLYYNKDIFDKFGVPYPKDGMTFKQVADLAAKLNRTEGGINYVGFGTEMGHLFTMNPYSAPYLDKDGNPSVDNDIYKKMIQEVVFQPGMLESWKEIFKQENRLTQPDSFTKNKRVAMYLYMWGTCNDKTDFNWDMVSMPTFSDKPGVGAQPYPSFAFIANTSKHKDQDMEILKYLVSDEFQMEEAKMGSIPIVTTQAVRNALASETGYANKNIKALFVNKQADPMPRTQWDNQVDKAIRDFLPKAITGEMDLNTLMRTANEEGAKRIQAAKGN